MKAPKFNIGDSVVGIGKYHQRISGTVKQIHRVYQRVDAAGHFEPHGLISFDFEFEGYKVPYECDGETLKVEMPASEVMNEPAHTEISKFKEFAYSVDHYIVPEKQLRKAQ